MDNKIIKFKKQKPTKIQPKVPVMLTMDKEFKEKLEKQAERFGATLEQYIMLILITGEKEASELIKNGLK